MNDREEAFLLHSHAGSHAKSSGNSGEYRDHDVDDFTPDRLVFHDS